MHAYISSTIPASKYLLSAHSAGRVYVCVQLERDMCLQINNTCTELIIPEANQIRDEGVGASLGSRVCSESPGWEMLPKPGGEHEQVQPFIEFSPHPPERQSLL